MSEVVLVGLSSLGRNWISVAIDPDSHHDWNSDGSNVGLGDPDNVTLLLVLVLVSVVSGHWDSAGTGGAKGDDSKVLHFDGLSNRFRLGSLRGTGGGGVVGSSDILDMR